MNPPENGQYYTVKELADVTSGPVRAALLALEAKVMMLEHDLAEAREAERNKIADWFLKHNQRQLADEIRAKEHYK